ncbi:MAG: hypothetical protein KAV97_00885 [Actinomycetia bacterium]|nr:hypothetical protein [Actinomycetes bacterium]
MSIQIDNFIQKISHKDTIVKLKYSPSGKFLISADRSGEIIIWSRGESKDVKLIRISYSPLTGIWFSEDENWLISGYQGGNILIYNFPEMNLEAEIRLKTDYLVEFQPVVAKEPVRDFWIRGVCFIPNSSKVVIGADDGTLEIWDYQLKHSKYIGRCPSGVRSIDVSPKGSKLAIGCEDGGIFLIPLHEFFQQK